MLLHLRRQGRDAGALQRLHLLLSEDRGLQLLLILRASFASLLVLCAAGCPATKPPPPPGCDDSFIGDPSQPPEAILVVSDGLSSTLTDVAAGDAVPLGRPPQGGEVTYASARVRNINRCAVTFAGRFRDPATGNELAFDGRSTDLVVGADGWGRPDATQVSNLTNIPLCPDNDPTRDNQGQPAILEMAVTDQHGHSVTVSQSVVPTCTALDAVTRALCVCECNHIPSGGRMCSLVDGGAP